MKALIKKGKVHTPINFSDRNFNYNLYCKEVFISEEIETSTVVLSLTFIKQSFNGGDFDELLENIDKVYSITFRDNYVIKNIKDFLRLNNRSTFKTRLEISIENEIYFMSVKLRMPNTTTLQVVKID